MVAELQAFGEMRQQEAAALAMQLEVGQPGCGAAVQRKWGLLNLKKALHVVRQARCCLRDNPD